MRKPIVLFTLLTCLSFSFALDLEEVAPYPRKNVKKLFYKASNAETYETASKNCMLYGGQLARISSAQDKVELRHTLRGQLATRLWIGAVPSSNCKNVEPFKAECWIWEGTSLVVNTGDWNPTLFVNSAKKQTSMSRAYYEKLYGTFNFDQNTTTYPFVSELF